ncbi:hypothetical protein [Pseudofrankia inefficax]|nr:hypothetical protein [Pseudofrankia inefficax]
MSVPRWVRGSILTAVGRRCPVYSPSAGNGTFMLIDIVVAIIIVAIAAALGLTVHPVLWVIAIAAVLWLVGRRGISGRNRSRL